MLSRPTILFPIILAGLMALLTFWINKTVEQQGPKTDGSNRHDADYIIENFVTKQTNEAGKLHYILAAQKMMHYPDDDSTVLEQPNFIQYATKRPYTKIKGDHANVSSDGEEIELLENVVVVRQALADKGELQVFTDKLTLFPNQDLAKTDSAVVIKQAPKTVIHATGMVYDKQNKKIRLLNKVTAHYEQPKR